MKRRLILAAALMLAPVGSALAQTAANAAAAAGGAADAGNNVTVTNKCCSIWDILGAPGITKFLGNNVFKSVLGQKVAKLLSPVGKVLGLGPSLLSDKFAESDNPAMSLAAKAKKEEKDAPLKVKAIKYLGTLDCNCYPEVVDALLASLDDCNESVRIAALKALQGKCKTKSRCKRKCGPSGLPCEPCDCCGCQCQKKVIEALNEHLLARDASGCLKERSRKVRDLATCMIEECLSRREPPPVEAEAAPSAAPPRVVPDPTPRVRPEETPRAAPESTRFVPKQSIFRKWFGSRSDDSVTQTLVIEDVVDPTPVARPVTRHTTGYRGLSASTSTRFEPVYIEPVLVQPTIDTQVSRPVESQVRTFKGASRSGRRHLFGELFGY